MAYKTNQYNYATPLSSAPGFVNEAPVADKKYFSLSDNVLDGSYVPASGDVGLWGTTIADANGNLSTPFVVTITESATISAFRLVGSQYNYPVAFTVKFYNGSTLLRTIAESNNTGAGYVYNMVPALTITHYEISITKISKASTTARVYNVYEPPAVSHADTLKSHVSGTSVLYMAANLASSDRLLVKQSEAKQPITNIMLRADSALVKSTSSTAIAATIIAADAVKAKEATKASVVNAIDKTTDALKAKEANKTAIVNTIDATSDKLIHKVVEARSSLRNIIDTTYDTLKVNNTELPIVTNVHSRMKEPSRNIYGKVYITYTDPMLDSETTITTSGSAYNSDKEQVLDTIEQINTRYFTLYDNRLDGSYPLSDSDSQVGWVSDVVSRDDGTFDVPPYIQVNFADRPVVGLPIYFDNSHGSIVEDFIVDFIKKDGTSETKTFTGNTEQMVIITDRVISNVVAIKVTVTKVSKPYHPAVIVELPVISTILYKGYKDTSDLISIDLLEELTYKDDIEALGGISANEVTVVLDNSNKQFYFNNTGSPVAQQLKRNRKIVPWLGVEIIPGEIEWYTLGTFWSYNWNVPMGSLTATVVGFDTIGLLSTTSFINHTMQVNKSLGDLIVYVLEDAKTVFEFITYKIDPELFNIVIPYAWFSAASHTAALQKISECYPMHIYCDRDGCICAAPQKLKLDYYYDTWADSTNVINKTYDSLYTTLPNVVNVTVNDPTVKENEQLVNDSLVFNIDDFPTRTLNFSKPYISDIVVSIDCDATVNYTYDVYSWGIEVSFNGTGNVRSIECKGTVLDNSSSSVITRRDEESIRLNGSVVRDVSSDFIQDSTLASIILNRLFSLYEADKYDASVDYRGDIALTINDPIRLLNGIAPDNRYNIKRHQLFWNGALSGSAELNT